MEEPQDFTQQPEKESLNELQMDPVTGITNDYLNAFLSKYSYLTSPERSMAWIAENIRTKPVKKYAERYSENKYTDVITDKNRESIAKLDEIVDQINAFGEDPSKYTRIELFQLMRDATDLIYSDKDIVQDLFDRLHDEVETISEKERQN